MSENISRTGNSYFARVYRADWVGSRSFSFREYGGQENALVAAKKWVLQAEERLPLIFAKPIRRRAKVTVRSDPSRIGLRYYDVYVPPVEGETTWSEKFYFKDLDEQKKAQEKANELCDSINTDLLMKFEHSLREWYSVMGEIENLWPEVKAMQV